MGLFKPLLGSKSRISPSITPYHPGYVYLTTEDGGLYADITLQDGTNKRIRVEGSADMQKTVYDPTGKEQDVYTYTDNALATKQDKITGTEGQVVGIGSDGNAIVRDAPAAGLTQTEGDTRYLQLSGGTMTGDLVIGGYALNKKLIIDGPDGKGILGGVSDSTPSSKPVAIEAVQEFLYDDFATGWNSSVLKISGRPVLFDCSINLNNHRISYIATPQYRRDAATKGYVDDQRPLSTTITLTAAGWDAAAKTQTVAVSGIDADETTQLIQPIAASASRTAYNEAGVQCISQATDSLTFSCKNVPTADLTVYIVVTPLG